MSRCASSGANKELVMKNHVANVDSNAEEMHETREKYQSKTGQVPKSQDADDLARREDDLREAMLEMIQN